MEDCSKYLIQDVEMKTSTRSQQIAWLSSITQEYYGQHYQEVDAEASVLGFGSADGDWKKFDQERTSYLSNQQFSFNSAEAASILRQKLSSNSLDAVRACEQANALAQRGLQWWVESETRTSVAFGFVWNVPSEQARPVVPVVVLGGGRVPSDEVRAGQFWPKDFQFAPGAKHIVIVDRIGEEDITASVDVGGESVNPRSLYIGDPMDFSGVWRAREGDLLDFPIIQQGDSLNATMDGKAGYHHEIVGKADDSAATIAVRRQAPAAGGGLDPCVNTMRGFIIRKKDMLIWRIESTDGQCGLPATYKETRVFDMVS